jgi:hypothetical protein
MLLMGNVEMPRMLLEIQVTSRRSGIRSSLICRWFTRGW